MWPRKMRKKIYFELLTEVSKYTKNPSKTLRKTPAKTIKENNSSKYNENISAWYATITWQHLEHAIKQLKVAYTNINLGNT